MESGRLTVSIAWERRYKLLLLTFCLTFLIQKGSGWAEELSGDALLRSRCAICHAAQEGERLDSIESGRRTPEGWEMTIDRMIRMHGVRLQPNEGQALVKYLSDHYGLAPSEIEPYRYALEKRNSTIVQSDLPKVVQGSCLTCHSYARIALQRRTTEAWKQMADTKLALFTNTENVTASSGLLNTFWYDDARKDAIPFIATQFPFSTDAWSKWQAAPKPNYEGIWKVVGHDPGKGGDYTGQLALKALGDDRYEGEFTHQFSDGSKVSGKTTVVVYTGFQWRGIAQIENDKKQQEIFFGSEDGSMLSGRRLLTGLGDIGMDEELYRLQEHARLLTIIPAALKTGEKRSVKLFGMNFPSGLSATAINLGEGVKVVSVVQTDDDTVTAEVTIEKEAKVGPRQVGVEGMQGNATLQIYHQVDYIRLFPEQGFARPGGIKARKLMEQLEAIGYGNGKDGVKGTQDDVRLGRVAPVKWNVEENVTRVDDDDVHFVGRVDENGLFIPAEDGPNAKRERLEHNVGDVWVEAWYTPDGAKRPVGARASMLVMPEKFSFQPIE
ncbi:MAG: quinohemoprotein amine dehydrogenase subunit alpha [Candidatus Binatia bacterium]